MELQFAEFALSALAGMKRADRRFVLDGIRLHLIQNDPVEVSRNKFPLKRPSRRAERELRLGDWRVFYTVMEERSLVIVNLIGVKRGNKLFIEGEEFDL
jgi:hypothetical protein